MILVPTSQAATASSELSVFFFLRDLADPKDENSTSGLLVCIISLTIGEVEHFSIQADTSFFIIFISLLFVYVKYGNIDA